jgi:hypothetical protein
MAQSGDTASGMIREFYVSAEGIPETARQATLGEWGKIFSSKIKADVIPIVDGDTFRFRLSPEETEKQRPFAATTATILGGIAGRPAGYQLVQPERCR